MCQSQKRNYSAFLNLSVRIFFFLDQDKWNEHENKNKNTVKFNNKTPKGNLLIC